MRREREEREGDREREREREEREGGSYTEREREDGRGIQTDREHFLYIHKHTHIRLFAHTKEAHQPERSPAIMNLSLSSS